MNFFGGYSDIFLVSKQCYTKSTWHRNDFARKKCDKKTFLEITIKHYAQKALGGKN